MDLIRILPENVANQIAAGEVVQRPASVVKELVENSIDAGATEIKVVIKDAGKTLIKVVDNGCGMSPTDARLCFERHATSKIRTIDDLYTIRTMGFRGEALAAIASVSQIEMKTKLCGDELGTLVQIEGSKIITQQPCQCENGTSISVKNLFFNTPARRNFLKSDNTEFFHIQNEFIKQALINYDIAFSLTHNNNTIYNLPKQNFQQRIISLLGNHLKNKLLPVNEITNYVKINGFVAKPEAAKKQKNEQFFFVNKRFIKSPYLNNAIENVFNEFIPEGYFPSYFINLTIDPKNIDVNIHPTKTEIKFFDDRLIYSILSASVKKSLGQHILVPTLDFDADPLFANIPPPPNNKIIIPPKVSIDPEYNPFKKSSLNTFSHFQNDNITNKSFSPHQIIENKITQIHVSTNLNEENIPTESTPSIAIIHNSFIITSVKSGMLLLERKNATERIIYEELLEKFSKQKILSQNLLFPLIINVNDIEYQFALAIKENFAKLGFEIDNFGKNMLVVNSIPIFINESEIEDTIKDIIKENIEEHDMEFNKFIRKNALLIAKRKSTIECESPINEIEAQNIIEKLFQCSIPEISPSGKPCFTIVSIETLHNLLKNK